ncbi:Fanconi anemia group I [Choanephora cucurbitarum]|uniref:Fanconi anemia group I n=1 Tax=Choanephora cucurbitarum TaxID=101091 RepID=A0A1C7NKT2_9FUNG|nr:Fanconi anemia group I [Choanephora cucurbitarum]
MDIEILKLSKQSNKQRLSEFLNEQPEEELIGLVRSKLDDYQASNDVDPILLLRAIVQGSPLEGGQDCLQRRFILLKCIIEWLSVEDKDIQEKSKQASLVVNLIQPEIENLPTIMLSDLAKMITDMIAETSPIQLRMLDIFSKIWNVLAAADKFSELGEIFDGLLEAKWHNSIVVGMSSALNDMELSKNQLEAVLNYMLKKLSDIESEEVPPFIYQLLLISRKGYKRLILNGILNFFNQESENETSQIESTVMLHLSFALKQDQELGNELIKMIKANKSSQLEVFNIACLLTAARIHRLQDPIFDLFKTNITSVYRDNEKLERCYWILDYSSIEADKLGQVLLEVTEKSATSGWDQVIQSLTQLSFILVDTATSYGAFFQTYTIKTRSSMKDHAGPMDKVANLGTDILLRLFKYHDIIRSEILEQITSRIVSRSSSTLSFLSLLATIIKDYPDTVDKYLVNIKDTLDFLSFLPLSTAERLLHAVQPISKSSEQFRDGLILVLRKSLFAKDLDGREMAVRGFLNILDEQLNELKSEQDSGQLLVAQGVAFEVLGLLRRCFGQQFEVRVCTYNGLGSLSQEHPTFAGDIFDLLYTQFTKVFEKDASIANPIKLDHCLENATNGGYPKIMEPVHLLLKNLIKSYRAASTEDTTSVVAETIDRFNDRMLSLVNRLSSARLEDFELDKTSSFDMATHIGLRNNLYAQLMLGIYEASVSSEHEGRKKNNQIHTPTCSSLEFFSKIFQAIFAQGDPEGSTRDLRSDIDFAHFIITSTFDSLKSAIDDVYCHQDDQHFESSIVLCQTYLSILKQEDSDSIFANQQSAKKTTSALSSVALSLRSTLDIISHVWPKRFAEFLKRVLGSTAPNQYRSKNKVILEWTMQLKEVILKYISGRTPIYREATHVMHVCLFLCNKFQKKDDDFSVRSRALIQWLNELTKERALEDPGLVKETIGLLIQLCADIGEFDVIQDICEDLHRFLGDLDIRHVDQPMEESLSYQMINQKTYSVILSKIFEFLDSSFDDLTWCISRLKISASEDNNEETTQQFEAQMCRRLTSLVLITSQIVKSILTDVHAESLFKTITKAYKTLLTLVKYKISFPYDVSPDFISVISKTGTEVTDRMYKFLTVYGQSQNADPSESRSKKKGKQKQVDLKQKAKIQRETKVIPNLIFGVEQFERHLIQLSRKSKVDFMQYMKRSTSRDFKIQVNRVYEDESDESDEDKGQQQEVQEENEEEEEEEAESLKRRADEQEDEEESQDRPSGSSKRAKRS